MGRCSGFYRCVLRDARILARKGVRWNRVPGTASRTRTRRRCRHASGESRDDRPPLSHSGNDRPESTKVPDAPAAAARTISFVHAGTSDGHSYMRTLSTFRRTAWATAGHWGMWVGRLKRSDDLIVLSFTFPTVSRVPNRRRRLGRHRQLCGLRRGCDWHWRISDSTRWPDRNSGWRWRGRAR
jgi:hypothetical protein